MSALEYPHALWLISQALLVRRSVQANFPPGIRIYTNHKSEFVCIENLKTDLTHIVGTIKEPKLVFILSLFSCCYCCGCFRQRMSEMRLITRRTTCSNAAQPQSPLPSSLQTHCNCFYVVVLLVIVIALLSARLQLSVK